MNFSVAQDLNIVSMCLLKTRKILHSTRFILRRNIFLGNVSKNNFLKDLIKYLILLKTSMYIIMQADRRDFPHTH